MIQKRIQIVVTTLFLLYAGSVFGRILMAVNFSGIPEIVQEERIFGEGEELRLMVAGDSVALGLGASSVENTFAYKVAEKLGENRRVVYKNIAEEGAQTKDVINKQLSEITAFNPDIVIMTIGGNDVVRLKSEKKTLERYKIIIDEMKDSTNATIYIANIPNFEGIEPLPIWHINLINKRAEEINAGIPSLEEERVKIIDVHEKWNDIPKVKEALSADRFHANDYGYTFWTDAFLERIEL